jgi:putative flippase GtrA
MSSLPTAPEGGSATRLSEPTTPQAAHQAGRLNAQVVRQFVKFGIVGVSNTLLAFAVYTLLLKAFDVWYLVASAIGFGVGAVNGFLLNRRWTFREHEGDALTPVRWTVVQGCGLLVNLGLVYTFVTAVGLDKLVGQACATAIVVVGTFFANRAWTFRMHPPAADSDSI